MAKLPENHGSSSVGAYFTARFDSRDGCPGCAGPIDEGDDVGWVDDEVNCAGCYREACEAEGIESRI
jgi:hypothetical protein